MEGSCNPWWKVNVKAQKRAELICLTTQQSLRLALHFGPTPPGSDFPVKLLLPHVHEVLKGPFNGPDLVYSILYLSLTQVCLLWNYGEGDIVLGTAFKECVSWTLTQQKLRRESLNLGICAQLWVVAWFTVLPFVCDPFLGAVTNSIIIISGPKKTIQRSYF